jgi:hypothetical protein
MLMKFSSEERALLAEIDAVVDIPRDTKPDVARKLYAQTKALADKLRGLSTVLEARGISRKKRMSRADVRSLAALTPELSLEDLSRCQRLKYSEDTINLLRLAAVTRSIRQGGAFGVGAPSPRFEPGSSQDPTASLRDDDDFDPSDADDKESHERAASFHRNCASKAKTLARCVENHKAADLHNSAAAGGDGDAARSASKRLKS